VSGGWGGGAEGGEADIAFCNILLGQEEMLRKGLSISESALLDIIEQRFPLLGFHQRERQNHRSQKQEWVENVSKVDCNLVRVFIVLRTTFGFIILDMNQVSHFSHKYTEYQIIFRILRGSAQEEHK
jgi:hypothetical protein